MTGSSGPPSTGPNCFLLTEYLDSNKQINKYQHLGIPPSFKN